VIVILEPTVLTAVFPNTEVPACGKLGPAATPWANKNMMALATAVGRNLRFNQWRPGFVWSFMIFPELQFSVIRLQKSFLA
jgi:hypothetical protein